MDVGGYREKRKAALEKFATAVAGQVIEAGATKALEPMSSADRKVVHGAITDIDGVTSRSEGDEPNRRVVISPPDRIDRPTVTYHPELFETLRQAQRFGFFGDRPIDEAVAHAEHYVAAIEGRGGRLIDLGAGGGLPGLVIADARPDLEIVLLDRREKRTDFLARAARRLGFDHVEVWCRDAGDVVRDVTTERDPGFDLVTARGFGPPEVTLRMGAGCVRRRGAS
ncbi:MAG: RsmG family class I SAM-dependent methyltransferase [Ilumatobacteraceae bacterium]